MHLDDDTCWQTFAARDRGSDGLFVAAVRTTGVYCRPGCAARLPLRRNTRFFPDPAAAENAGYRPCRRCHPQDSQRGPLPGTAATVSRALKLMSEGRAGTRSNEFEQLARRLGVGPRHLRRLFAEHLGASPSAVARRLRLEEARRLIEQPRLGIGDIADAAGFKSRRCFNEAFRKAFGAAPREMRKQAAAAPR